MRWVIDGLNVIEPALQDSRVWGIMLLDLLERSKLGADADHKCQVIKRRVQKNNEVFERDLAAIGAWRKLASECIGIVEKKGRLHRCWEKCKTSYKRVLRRK